LQVEAVEIFLEGVECSSEEFISAEEEICREGEVIDLESEVGPAGSE